MICGRVRVVVKAGIMVEVSIVIQIRIVIRVSVCVRVVIGFATQTNDLQYRHDGAQAEQESKRQVIPG